MANTKSPSPVQNLKTLPHSGHRLPINVDALAIGIALTLAALIRFGLIPQVSF